MSDSEADKEDGIEYPAENDQQPEQQTDDQGAHLDSSLRESPRDSFEMPMRKPPVVEPKSAEPPPTPPPARPANEVAWEQIRKSPLGRVLFGKKMAIRLGIVASGVVIGLIFRLAMPPVPSSEETSVSIPVEQARSFDYDALMEYESERLNAQ